MRELNHLQVLYTIIAATLTVITAATWITYARTTVANIENKLKRNGIKDMFAWDTSFGVKSIFIALALGFRVGPFQTARTPFIDGAIVNQVATKREILFSKVYLVISFLFVGTITMGCWVLAT